MEMANKQNCGGVAGYSEAITNKPRMVSHDRRTKEGSVAEVHSVEERVLNMKDEPYIPKTEEAYKAARRLSESTRQTAGVQRGGRKVRAGEPAGPRVAPRRRAELYFSRVREPWPGRVLRRALRRPCCPGNE
jgi:hypothetical protein